MTYLLPPLNALRAFEASARHRSFGRAAAELHVTPGAVGQQVRALERLLGVALFERTGTGLQLSAAGYELAPALRRAFEQITQATQGLRPAHAALVRLGVRAGLSLAPRGGLARRLEQFRETVGRGQGIVVRVWQPAGLEELAEGKIDLAIDRPERVPGGYRPSPLPAGWAGRGDCLLAADGRVDCPEIAALAAWLLVPTDAVAG